MGVEVFIPAAEFAATAAEISAAGAEAAAALAAVELAAAAAPLVILGAGIGGLILGKQLWDKYHLGGSPPELAPQTFGGLQDKPYDVTVNFQIKNQPEMTQTARLPGPIYGTYSTYETTGNLTYGIAYRTGRLAVQTAPKESYIKPFRIISITPVDGQPDNDQRPRDFQPTLPRDFPIPVPRPFVLPGETVPTPFTPEVYPQPVTQPDTPPDEKKSPGVIVKIPETGTQLEITPQGVFKSRYLPTPGTPNVPIQTPPPPATKKVAVDPCPCPEEKVDLTEVKCRLKQLEKNLLDDGFDYTPHAYGAANSRTVDSLPDVLDRVELTVTNTLAAKYSEYGGPNAPDPIYCGWFSFRTSGRSSERIRIPYANCVFSAPASFDGFSFTATNGALISCSAVTKKKRPYVDAC